MGNEKLFMAVDLGTSFIKSGVYTIDGELLASWSEPVQDERPVPGIFIQRGEALYGSVCNCLRKTAHTLGDRAENVSAIAFTGQMAGSIGVGENWEDITTWSCSLDSRYLPYAQRQREQCAAKLYEISGTNAPVMCSKYEWFKNEFPEEHKRIAKYVMLNGYIIGKLSRVPVSEAKIDYSLIAWTGMADIQKREWSEEICSELGVDMSILPNIAKGTDIGGYLHEDVARELSLPAGIPLILGAGDKVSGCAGAGILDDGDMIFEAASYGAISCNVKDARLDYEENRYDIIGAVDENSYYVHKYIQGSGITIDWFVNNFIREGNDSKGDAFKRAEAISAGIPVGSEKMLAVGLLGGSAMPFDSEMKGLFMGHTWSHTKGHFYHALLEGFSYDLALTLERIERKYPEYKDSRIKLIGGGAKSAIWPQMLANVTGHTFEWLDREDVALWGAALLAAAGIGELKDVREKAKSHVGIQKVYRPDKVQYQKYQPYIRLYEEFTGRLHEFYKKLNNL